MGFKEGLRGGVGAREAGPAMIAASVGDGYGVPLPKGENYLPVRDDQGRPVTTCLQDTAS